MKKYFSFANCLLSITILFFTSCGYTHKLSKQADKILIADTAIRKGFIGISVYDPATNKYLYNYNADKYFVPASNTKLFTLYAGMKYLGDSLVGAKIYESNDTVFFKTAGDPTFLHKDFPSQKLFKYFSSKKGKIILDPFPVNDNFQKYGTGWMWDDYLDASMVERSSFPIYGNVFTFTRRGSSIGSIPSGIFTHPYFEDLLIQQMGRGLKFVFSREENSNLFHLNRANDTFNFQQVPFIVSRDEPYAGFQRTLLAKALNVKDIGLGANPHSWNILHSQPSDSLFKPMMHRSDNFFAEQTLLMTSNEYLGYMSDEQMIDAILKTSLKDAPQKPKWVDGSGLSRYNLFTPQDFIYILNKMKNEFGMDRMKNILATGGEGTLKNYFLDDAGFIYAKTGTLSNNCALSGYIITKQNKLLIFSVLVNNYQTGATPVRRAVEKFVNFVRNQY